MVLCVAEWQALQGGTGTSFSPRDLPIVAELYLLRFWRKIVEYPVGDR